jgi:glutamine amidotransferase
MAVPEKKEYLLAQCEDEGLLVAAAIKRDNITGLQFHPEKSGKAGLKILHKFINT